MWVWGSLLVSLVVFDDDDVIVLGMPWQWGHTLSIFSALSFTEKPRELGGFDSTHISLSHAPPLPPILPLCSPPPPSPLCLSHSDSSVGSVLLCFPFLLLPSPHLSPFSWNVTVFLHSVTPFVFLASCTLCLQMRSKESYEPEMERNVSVVVFFLTYLLGLLV